ncbi:MAG: sigma-70 family RNA polymerase sigma factor [Deltaproteobacteria bacterium]|nr:MAG: sigma-70 family RNA polymerase sigma factor [Deltaproteobacteria bacterium]
MIANHDQVARDRAPATAREEFEAAVLPHRRALYACALRYTRNRGDAEDLVQEALARAFAAWSGFVPGSNARAWLFRIMTNQFITGCRRRRRERRLETEAREDAVRALYGADRTQAARDPERFWLQWQVSDAVVAALAALTPEHREVILLADLGGRSYRDVAGRLGVPIGTVMSRLFRARRQLEAELADYAAREYGIARRVRGCP